MWNIPMSRRNRSISKAIQLYKGIVQHCLCVKTRLSLSRYIFIRLCDFLLLFCGNRKEEVKAELQNWLETHFVLCRHVTEGSEYLFITDIMLKCWIVMLFLSLPYDYIASVFVVLLTCHIATIRNPYINIPSQFMFLKVDSFFVLFFQYKNVLAPTCVCAWKMWSGNVKRTLDENECNGYWNELGHQKTLGHR